MSSMFRTNDGIPMRVMTIKEFCACIGISRTSYHRLPKKPDLMRIGNGAIRISRDAALRWAKEIEESSQKHGGQKA